MSIIQEIQNLIQESYIFSDKTISVDLHKFESGEFNKLILLCPMVDQIKYIGQKLENKYNATFTSDDLLYNKSNNFSKYLIEQIVSPKRQIIASIHFAFIYNREYYDHYDHTVTYDKFLNNSFIFLKESLLKKILIEYKFEDIDYAINNINGFKKERLNENSDSVIKEFLL